MNALSSQQWVIAFRWNNSGNSMNKRISKQEAARDNLDGTIIRIGRDKQSCNLHLENDSVSAQHAEIYFNEQQQKFFIKSLKSEKIIQVDGVSLAYGEELPLKQDSTIVVGQQKLEVTDIKIYELPSTTYTDKPTNTLSLQQWVIAFRWDYNGNSKNKRISKQEAARDNLDGAIIRIGRSEPSCNLHLEDSSVSAQHAEIYFNEQQQKFFIKSLQSTNRIQLDGQDLAYGTELSLKPSSTIVLGRQKIEVTDIQIYELQPTTIAPVSPNSNSIAARRGSASADIVPVSSNPNPIATSHDLVPIHPTSVIKDRVANVKISNDDPTEKKSKKWWEDSTVRVALITAMVTLAGTGVTYFSNIKNQETEKFKAEKQKEVDESKFNRTFTADQTKQYQDRLLAHRDKVLKLREKDTNGYEKLQLINLCSAPVNISASFTALDEVPEVKGWLVIEPKGDVSPGYATKYWINLYAYAIKDGKKLEWTGDSIHKVTRDVIMPDDFTYIEDPLFGKGRNPEKKDFYELKFDPESVKNSNGGYTVKTFSCEGDILQLKDGDTRPETK